MLNFALSFLLLGTLTGSTGPDIADRLRWGMSRDDVRRFYPDALRDPVPGEAGNAVVEGAQIFGCRTDAQLFFGRSGLET